MYNYQHTETITGLKAYIAQLTDCINDNNQKYITNLQSIKNYYEANIQLISNENNSLREENLLLKNQNLSINHLTNKNTKQLQQLSHHNQSLKTQLHQQQLRYHQLKNQLKQYEHQIQSLNEIHHQQIIEENNKSAKIIREKQHLYSQLKQSNQEIKSLHAKIKRLQQQIIQKINLPQHLRHTQLLKAKIQTNFENLNEKYSETQRERDMLRAELLKVQTQTNKTKVENQKLKLSLSNKVSAQLAKKQVQYEKIFLNNTAEKEKILGQVNQLYNNLKEQQQKSSYLQKQIASNRNIILKQQKENLSLKQDKSIYMQQFRKLKSQYQLVISKLQNSLIQFQNKNFSLQEHNKDLNSQLEGVQKLLIQISTLNKMATLPQNKQKQLKFHHHHHRQVEKQLKQQKHRIQERILDDEQRWNRIIKQVSQLQF